jgi:hypothetical protein
MIKPLAEELVALIDRGRASVGVVIAFAFT